METYSVPKGFELSFNEKKIPEENPDLSRIQKEEKDKSFRIRNILNSNNIPSIQNNFELSHEEKLEKYHKRIKSIQPIVEKIEKNEQLELYNNEKKYVASTIGMRKYFFLVIEIII